MKRLFIILSIFLLILGCNKKENKEISKRMEAPIKVKVKKVEFRNIPVYVTLVGYAKSKNIANISPKINGYIEKINYNVGDYVEKGKVVAVIVNKEMEDKLKSLKAKLKAANAGLKQVQELIEIDKKSFKQAESNFKFAKKTYLRFKNLLKSESITKQEFDKVLNEFTNAKLEVEKAKKLIEIDKLRVREAKDNILSLKNSINSLKVITEYRYVKAPFDGIIVKKFIDKGNFINVGMPILQIATRELEGVFYVPSTYFSKLKLGDKIYIKGKPYKIIEISPNIDRTSSKFQIKVNIDKNFVNGEYIEAKLKIGSRKAILIDKKYIHQVDSLNFTFIAKDNFVLKVFLKIRDYNHSKDEVISGLNKNDMIIVEPLNNLKDKLPCTY